MSSSIYFLSTAFFHDRIRCLEKFWDEDRGGLWICHDFKGSYRADACVHGSFEGCVASYGTDGGGPVLDLNSIIRSAEERFTIGSWRSLCGVMYFGHDLLSLPPVGWIDAG